MSASTAIRPAWRLPLLGQSMQHTMQRHEAQAIMMVLRTCLLRIGIIASTSIFAALAGQRAAEGRAVFALEHCLKDNEIQTLETEVRESLKVRSPSDAFWLPWVVYATEVGYKYDGEEYWQTFEQTTPGWTTCRAKPREWLRDRFVGFHKTYKGMSPSGRWASWFSIIAWPIQHAILPGYLQYHLAKLLYELRFDFTARLLSDPNSLGHYIHAESGRSVKRLQEFAEEHRWQTIRVWPVGLCPPNWDGEGWAEWLVTDRPIVGIASDRPVRTVDLVLDGRPPCICSIHRHVIRCSSNCRNSR